MTLYIHWWAILLHSQTFPDTLIYFKLYQKGKACWDTCVEHWVTRFTTGLTDRIIFSIDSPFWAQLNSQNLCFTAFWAELYRRGRWRWSLYLRTCTHNVKQLHLVAEKNCTYCTCPYKGHTKTQAEDLGVITIYYIGQSCSFKITSNVTFNHTLAADMCYMYNTHKYSYTGWSSTLSHIHTHAFTTRMQILHNYTTRIPHTQHKHICRWERALLRIPVTFPVIPRMKNLVQLLQRQLATMPCYKQIHIVHSVMVALHPTPHWNLPKIALHLK